MYEATEKGTFVAGQFQPKFSQIPYTYLSTGLGLKKRRTRKHKRKRTIKVVRQGRSKVKSKVKNR